MTTCRAVVLPSFGEPEVLEVHNEEPLPDLSPADVLVRVHAAGVNPLDLRMRAGYGKSIFEAMLPLILGRDVSGVVAATGSEVQELKVGDAVFGALHPTAERGTYSDYAIVAEQQLYLKPKALTHVEAAAIPFAALTAWRALRDTARIVPGQRVLILGAGGAVGLAAVQLAVAARCTVAATCGKQSCERVLEAGASQAVDYANSNVRQMLERDTSSTSSSKFDAVLDTIGSPETEALGIELLRSGGDYMTLQGEVVSLVDQYGLVAGGAAAASKLLQKQMQHSQSRGVNYHWTVMRTDTEALEEIARLAGAGKLKVPVGQTLPLTDAAKAHRALEAKQIQGKLVLQAGS